MMITIIESNPKIQCQYVLLKARKYFWWISYETYCLKVSLSKKLILSQFSQKEITKILPTVCFPHTYFKKKMSLMDLFWGGKEKL